MGKIPFLKEFLDYSEEIKIDFNFKFQLNFFLLSTNMHRILDDLPIHPLISSIFTELLCGSYRTTWFVMCKDKMRFLSSKSLHVLGKYIYINNSIKVFFLSVATKARRASVSHMKNSNQIERLELRQWWWELKKGNE